MVSYSLIAFFILLEDFTKCSISVASLHFREQACTRRTLAISRAPATMLVSLNGCFCLRIGQTSGSIPYLVLSRSDRLDGDPGYSRVDRRLCTDFYEFWTCLICAVGSLFSLRVQASVDCGCSTRCPPPTALGGSSLMPPALADHAHRRQLHGDKAFHHCMS